MGQIATHGAPSGLTVLAYVGYGYSTTVPVFTTPTSDGGGGETGTDYWGDHQIP